MQWLKNSFYQFISGIINMDNSYKLIYFSLNTYICFFMYQKFNFYNITDMYE